MAQEERDRIARIAALCRTAAESLGNDGSFRLRVLLRMVLLELEKATTPKLDDDEKGNRQI